jgi:hypothetical protein
MASGADGYRAFNREAPASPRLLVRMCVPTIEQPGQRRSGATCHPEAPECNCGALIASAAAQTCILHLHEDRMAAMEGVPQVRSQRNSFPRLNELASYETRPSPDRRPTNSLEGSLAFNLVVSNLPFNVV